MNQELPGRYDIHCFTDDAREREYLANKIMKKLAEVHTLEKSNYRFLIDSFTALQAIEEAGYKIVKKEE